MENNELNKEELNNNSVENNEENLNNENNSSISSNDENKLQKDKTPFFTKIKNFFLPKGIQLEMLRYRPNKSSFNFGILATLFLALGFCTFYSSTEIRVGIEGFNLFGVKEPGYFLGVDIVINILLMLFMLYSAMRMKAYSLSQGVASICMGAFQIVRIFLLPLSLKNCGVMTSLIYTLITIFYIISGVSSILAGLLSIYRGSSLKKYLLSLKENE